MILLALSYVPTLILLVILAVFILQKNSKDRKNRIFALILLFVALWLVSLYIADSSSNLSLSLVSLRFAMFFTNIIPPLFILFAFSFPNYQKISKLLTVLIILPSVVLAPLSLTDLVVREVGHDLMVAEPKNVGLMYTLILTYFFIYNLAALFILIKKHKYATGSEKAQIKLIFISALVAILLNLVGNYLFVLLGISEFAVLLNGPSIVLLAIGITYAIIRHKLFDIRLIVARSVAYVLTVATISLIYGFGAFSILGIFIFQDQQIPFSQQIVYTFLAITLVFTFQPIKKFFDKVSNKIFYRDAYDSQELLDNLGSLIVGQIDLDVIMSETLELLNDGLRPTKSVFLLTDENNEFYKRYGNADFIRSREKMILKDLDSQQNTVMILDEETDGMESWKNLKKYDVAVSVRMSTTTQTVGYLLLGSKKSGNIYSSQDSKLLNIASSELAVATENALRFDEIQKFNITLQKKIEDATAQLRRTNEKLRALDEAKDEFISMASHQLRTPLTSIKGYVSMLMDGDAGKPNTAQAKLLGEAFASSQRMVYLIADLLNVSRLKTGKFVIEPTDIFLPKVVQGEVSQVLPSAKSKHITLTYDAPKHFPMVSLDETKIRQVIMNFIDNAIYYTPQGGKIDVQLIAKKDVIEYKVVDNGIGVPRDQQSKLFSKFFRADNAKKARPDGTGLGLYMASKVVSAQGGSIIFSSEVGKGSTFGFSFPLSKVKAKKS
ncbi:hypothetical protein DYH10_03675 [Candidatus Saccharibacteria bacterium CPR2]|nr:hypothetical protein [Candidatus Saccharibacteria bacterium CPR2]